MARTSTFAILKPLYEGSNPETHGQILTILDRNGFGILLKQETTLDRRMLEEHYAHHNDKDFFKPMLDYLVSGPSILLILDHEGDAVLALRQLAGPTDPKKGTKGLIRHDFGLHREGVLHKNAIHASGDSAEALSEITRFFGPDMASRFAKA